MHTSILVEPDFVAKIIKACCILHSFVRRRDSYDWNTLSNTLVNYQNNGIAGARVRDYIAEYFVGTGAITYQNFMLFSYL